MSLFHDGFENAGSGEQPGYSVVGGIEASDNVIVQQGLYEAGDETGPAAANNGNNYLVMDRVNLGGNNAMLVFDVDEPFALADTRDFTAVFWVWADPVRAISFGTTSGDDFDEDTIATWNNLDGAKWQLWNDGAWVDIDMSAAWLAGQWNKITLHYDGQSLTGTLNDGQEIPLLWWGGPTLPIDRLRFRSGTDTSTFYLDDVLAVVNGQPIPELQPAQE